MMQSAEINELAEALAKAQGSFEDVLKSKKAEVGKYSYTYADLATVLQAVRKPLSENGLALAQMTHSENGAFWLESCLLHKSGQYITATWPLPAQGTPQQIGSALTYARRYTASALLGIASEDDDGEAGGQVKATTGPKRQPKVAQKDKTPFWRDGGPHDEPGGSTTENTDSAGHGFIHVYDAQANYQTLPRTQKGAAQAVTLLEKFAEQDLAAVWEANREWALEVSDKLGKVKDPSADDTRSKLTLAERIGYIEDQAVAAQEALPDNLLAAG